MKQKKRRLSDEEEEACAAALASFKHWWEPFSHDPQTGASVGGQPNALRWWARPPATGGGGRWDRRMYGELAKVAFRSNLYYKQWLDWRISGSPHGQWVEWLEGDQLKHDEPFVSNCVDELTIAEEMRKITALTVLIGK